MSELAVFVFRDQFRAPEVLNELRRRSFSWFKDPDDAVAVTLDGEGKAKVHLIVNVSEYREAGWARIWGALLRAMLFSPVPEVMIEAAEGIAYFPRRSKGAAVVSIEEHNAAKNGKEMFQLSDNFKRDVSALMGPNCSAILMLLQSSCVPAALEQMRNYGDTIVHTSLNSEQDKKMQAMLARV